VAEMASVEVSRPASSVIRAILGRTRYQVNPCSQFARTV
jgi:hypothetical protein